MGISLSVSGSCANPQAAEMKLSPNGPQNHLPSTNTLSLSTNGKLKCLNWVYSFSAGHNSFSTNGPIQWNDWRDNHGLWLCLSVFLDASFVATSTNIRVLKLKGPFMFFCFYFYLFSPRRGQAQVQIDYFWTARAYLGHKCKYSRPCLCPAEGLQRLQAKFACSDTRLYDR